MEPADGIAPDPPAAPPVSALQGLPLRIASAFVLGVVTVAAAWAGVLPFAVLVVAVGLIMTWEWSAVVRGVSFDLTVAVQGFAVVAAAVLTAFGFAALGVSILIIGTIVVLALEFGARPILAASGVLYAGLPAVALIWLRASEPLGFHAVMFIVTVVAATDTAAFVCGRLIGGPKLAARISPKKTWSGLAGGISAAALTAAAYGTFLGKPALALALTGALMGLIAQLGDLGESALKRSFDVKDSSQLLPGHGGFMDRVDGLVPVAVLLAFAAFLLDPKVPAEALFAGLALARY